MTDTHKIKTLDERLEEHFDKIRVYDKYFPGAYERESNIIYERDQIWKEYTDELEREIKAAIQTMKEDMHDKDDSVDYCIEQIDEVFLKFNK